MHTHSGWVLLIPVVRAVTLCGSLDPEDPEKERIINTPIELLPSVSLVREGLCDGVLGSHFLNRLLQGQ